MLRPNELSPLPDKDLLVIGTLAHLGAASGLLARSPYRVDGDSLHVLLTGALGSVWHLFGDRTDAARQSAAAALTTPLGEGAAVMIGAQAPEGHRRSVVALLAGSPQGLEAMVEAMRNARQAPDIQGDLALLAGGTVTSYRGGGAYTVGELPFWLWPEWWLQDRPAAIVGIMLLAAAVMGTCLYRVFRWQASRRVARRRPTPG